VQYNKNEDNTSEQNIKLHVIKSSEQ